MREKHKILSGLTAVAMLCTATGCVYEGAVTDCPDSSKTPSSFMLNLNLTVPASADAMTRTSGDETDPATAAESHIYIDLETDKSDIYVLLFSEPDGSLLSQISGDACEVTMMENTLNAQYTVSVPIVVSESQKSLFDEFSVVVLANWHSCGSMADNFPSFADYNIGQSSNSIFKDDANFNYTFFPGGTPDTTPWQPGDERNQYIPMFGMYRNLNLEDIRHNSTEVGSYDGTTIPMLRAMAKVEIVDMTTEEDASSSSFSEVSVSHFFTGGRLIPDIYKNPDWNNEGIQIVEPSFANFAGVNFQHVGMLPMIGPVKKDGYWTWTLYVPECILDKDDSDDYLNNNNSKTNSRAGLPDIPDIDSDLYFRPFFGLTKTQSAGGTRYFSFDNEVKALPTKPSRTTGNGELHHTLRNHIYRYTVTESGMNVRVDLTVQPWDFKYDSEPWNFDTPVVSKYLEWDAKDLSDENSTIENGYTDMGLSECRLLMNPATDTYVEGTFTLTAPMHCRWYAYLRTTGSGEPDAFYFTNGEVADGSDTYFVEGGDSGMIDGNPITLKIACKRAKVSVENNEQYLVIMVQYPDKTQREVNVVSLPTDGIKANYTLVQQVTEVM